MYIYYNNILSTCVVSCGGAAVKTSKEAMEELMGEHEAITVYMHSLTKSADGLAAQPARAKERLWNYRQRLYDFKDAIWYHLEVDERIFKSVLGRTFLEDPIEEHQEIQRLVNDMILMADNTIVERMGQEELDQFCGSLGEALKKMCQLIQLHMAKEDSILKRAQQALNHQQV
jgi:hypothetical protein